MQTCKNCQSAIPDAGQTCPFCGDQVQKHDDVRRHLWLRMRVGTIASSMATTPSAGSFATSVIASALVLGAIILGLFLRPPPVALHATTPVVIVTPARLDFGMVDVDHKVVLTEMIKTNNSSQPQWKAVSGNPQWLNVMLSSAVKGPDNFREIIYDVTANTSKLREGQYSVIFAISAGGAKDPHVLITIQVVHHPLPAQLNVNPLLLDFGTQSMSNQGTQSLTVSNKGQADLHWMAEWGNAPWLILDQSQGKIASGGLPEIIQVKVDTTTLTAGRHSISINFTSNGGNASVNVVLFVAVGSTPAPPSVPIVSSVSPNSGPTGGGTIVIITGSGFMDATAVLFGSTKISSFTIINDKQISVDSPAGSGTVDVIVVTTNGTSATSTDDLFTYNTPPIPMVTNVSPNSGSTGGGTMVTIAGSGFMNATAVLFGSTKISSFTIINDKQISVDSPAGSGTVDVTVSTPSGVSATSSADLFTYMCPFESDFSTPPTVTNVSPSNGSAAGGTTVIITGTCFYGGTYGVYNVLFGSRASKFTVNSDSQITAVSPAGSGTVDVTVVTTNGTSATSADDLFTYKAPPIPMVTGISPINGLDTGGTMVTITGSNFTGATSISFGSAVAKIITTSSDGTQITVVSPPSSIDGIVDVTVTTPWGTSAISSADQFLYYSVG